MKILAIETSCDETAVSVIEARGDTKHSQFTICGNNLLSQVALHQEYGGVYPSLAKREHAKNLVPILEQTLKEAGLAKTQIAKINDNLKQELQTLLTREPELFERLIILLEKIGKPDFDSIAVTYGPGLEPALWVGINFAKALSLVWKIPLIPVNHMEGHIFSGLLNKKADVVYEIKAVTFPVLALLISGGHTELVLMKEWGTYNIIGSTRDDAVGEAFDKVARLLSLPYPGGPEISRLAEKARQENITLNESFPRPMLTSDNYDFSFSGLKTAVLYYIKDKTLGEELKQKIAREFEESAIEVLVHKSLRAIEEYGVQTFITGGGVSANAYLRAELKEKTQKYYPTLILHMPEQNLTTDNAIMIGIAGYFKTLLKKGVTSEEATAIGNLKLS